jgi:hypothetical protein
MLSTNDIIYNLAIPAAAGMAFVFLSRRTVFAGTWFERHAATSAILVALFVCSRMLVNLEWIPKAERDWLIYMVIPAAILGPIALLPAVSVFERLPMYALAGLAVAWFVVPTFDDLNPPYLVQFGILVGGVVLLPSCLEPVFERLPGIVTPLVLASTAGGGAAVMMLSKNAGFAQLSAAAAAGLGGIALIGFFSRGKNLVRGTAPLLIAFLGALMLVGRAYSTLYSSVPTISYVLIPVAPLLMGLAAWGPAAGWSAKKRAALQIILPLVAIGIAVGLGLQAEWNAEAEYPQY